MKRTACVPPDLGCFLVSGRRTGDVNCRRGGVPCLRRGVGCVRRWRQPGMHDPRALLPDHQRVQRSRTTRRRHGGAALCRYAAVAGIYGAKALPVPSTVAADGRAAVRAACARRAVLLRFPFRFRRCLRLRLPCVRRPRGPAATIWRAEVRVRLQGSAGLLVAGVRVGCARDRR